MSWVKDAIAHIQEQTYEVLHQTVHGGYGTKPDIFWAVDPIDMPEHLRDGIDEDLIAESCGSGTCFIIRIETFPAFDDEDLRSTGSPVGCFNVYVGTDASNVEYSRQINIYDERPKPTPSPSPRRDLSKRATMHWDAGEPTRIGRTMRRLSVAIGLAETSDDDRTDNDDSDLSPPISMARRKSSFTPTPFRRMSLRPSWKPVARTDSEHAAHAAALTALEGGVPSPLPAKQPKLNRPRKMSPHTLKASRQSMLQGYTATLPPFEDEPGSAPPVEQEAVPQKTRGSRPMSMFPLGRDVPKVDSYSVIVESKAKKESEAAPKTAKLEKRKLKAMSMFAGGEEVPDIEVHRLEPIATPVRRPSGPPPSPRRLRPNSMYSIVEDGLSMQDQLAKNDGTAGAQPHAEFGNVARKRKSSLMFAAGREIPEDSVPEFPAIPEAPENPPVSEPPVGPSGGDTKAAAETSSMLSAGRELQNINTSSLSISETLQIPEAQPTPESSVEPETETKTLSMIRAGRELPNINTSRLAEALDIPEVQTAPQSPVDSEAEERKMKTMSMHSAGRELPRINTSNISGAVAEIRESRTAPRTPVESRDEERKRKGMSMLAVGWVMQDFGTLSPSETADTREAQGQATPDSPVKSTGEEGRRKVRSMFIPDREAPFHPDIAPLRMHAPQLTPQPPASSRASSRSRKAMSMFSPGLEISNHHMDGLDSISEPQSKPARTLPTPSERKMMRRSMNLFQRDHPQATSMSAEARLESTPEHDIENSFHHLAKAAARRFKTGSWQSGGGHDSPDLEISCQGMPSAPLTTPSNPNRDSFLEQLNARLQQHADPTTSSGDDSEDSTSSAPTELDPQMDHYLLPQGGVEHPNPIHSNPLVEPTSPTHLRTGSVAVSWVDSRADTHVGTLSHSETYADYTEPTAARVAAPPNKMKRMTLRFLGRDLDTLQAMLRDDDDDSSAGAPAPARLGGPNRRPSAYPGPPPTKALGLFDSDLVVPRAAAYPSPAAAAAGAERRSKLRRIGRRLGQIFH